MPIPTLATLAAGPGSRRDLLEQCLARIADPAGEGARTFIEVDAAGARAAADASDQRRALGALLSPLDGMPVSVKDLFDIAGQVTRAGSRVLADAAPAAADAVAVRRLRAAGAVIIGRTNTVEFAFSGLGINPHYGTPRNPWDRATGRIPGGSSSGAAVSVTDGMAAVAIGTDTGGSVRIPAALCGLAGFKPTARRVPTDGVFPLSTSLDSVGPLGASVACCALVDAILAGEPAKVPASVPLAGLRLGLLRDPLVESGEPQVAHAVETALGRLARAGATIVEVRSAALAHLPRIDAQGGVVLPEAWAIHRDLFLRHGARYDPRVARRVRLGATIPPAASAAARVERRALVAAFARSFAAIDALVLPTVPLVAPPLLPLEADGDLYDSTDRALLRNTSIINAVDGCALSVPCHEPGAAPVGLMLAGAGGSDRRLLGIGMAVEAALAA